MNRIKIAVAVLFLTGLVATLAGTSLAYPPFLKVARKFGAKDCTFCHVNPEGGEPSNERGKWLAAEKERRSADVVDPEWLVDYKPGVTSEKKSPLEQELMKLEVEWADAIKKHDKAALERLLADDLLHTDEDGRVISKAEYIARTDGAALESYGVSEVSVRSYGNTAIVSARWTIKGSAGDRDFSGDYRETNVWVKKGGRWQVVATQVGRVKQP